MKRLRVAFSLLTRLPVGELEYEPGDLGRSAAMFPVVGAFLGFLTWGLYAVPREFGWQMDAWLFAVVAVTLGVLLTGALHLDGLADTVDGLAGGSTPGEMRRIMKDPHVGALGATALFLALVLRCVCLVKLCQMQAFAVVVMAPVLSRFGAVALAFGNAASPPERSLASEAGAQSTAGTAPSGLGQSFAFRLGMSELAGAAFWVLAFAGVGLVLFPSRATGWGFGLGAAMVLIVVVWLRAVARRRIGSITGDVLGACIEGVEVTALLVGALVFDALGTR